MIPFWAILFVLPFGQLLGFRFQITNFGVNLLVLDLVVFVAFLLSLLLVRYETDKTNLVILIIFLAYLMFSLVVGSFVIEKFSIVSLLYAIRFLAYLISVIFFSYVFKFEKQNKVLNYILISLLVAGAFGIFQYLYYPDLRLLKQFGWDDHLGRLVGTYFDPGFMSALMVVGSVISLFKAYTQNRVEFYALFVFFSVTLLLTYARAGYLAFVVCVLYLGLVHKKIVYSLAILLVFVLSILILPRGEGHGVMLERTHSIEQRLDSYEQSLQIFASAPIFGIGYNNLCLVKNIPTESHACFGADNSILLVLSTLGVVGLILVIEIVRIAYTKLSSDHSLVVAVALGIFTTSMFINSVTYPFLLILLVMLYSLNLVSIKE